MRKRALQMVYELAKRDPRVLFMGSDLGVGTLDDFKRELPERFFMEGVSEAAVIGMAAGLALEGKIPYINTIATFLTRRCFEQIVLDLCLHNVDVRLIGSGGGLVYAPLGPTHQAIDDIAILRTIPNMTVVAPADAVEMDQLMARTLDWKGPIYIRLAKGGDPIVTPREREFRIGKAIRVREGGDALIVTTGVTLQIALAAADKLATDGLRAGILHMPTIKPFDRNAFLAATSEVRAVVSVEEGTVIGGLGSAAAEALAEGLGSGVRFKRLGIPDVFPHDYGSQANLMRLFDLTPESVATSVAALCG
jgi:transketolase